MNSHLATRAAEIRQEIKKIIVGQETLVEKTLIALLAGGHVILEGVPKEIKDRAVWKRFTAVYNQKYGGNVEPLLESTDGNIYCVEPETAFGQDEHAENFAESVTRWRFSKT